MSSKKGGTLTCCEEEQTLTLCWNESKLEYSWKEKTHANAMWQADHTPLDVWLLDEAGNPAKPYLTAIEDDYSRIIVGYRLSFQVATALTTALTLRQASYSH